MRRLLVLLVFMAGCGGGHTPPQTHPEARWALTVQTEPSAAVRILDGPNALTRGVADDAGHLLLQNLQQSGFTVCAVATGYRERCVGVTLTSAQSVTLRLEPTAPPVPPAPIVRADGPIFRTAAGAPWRYKGVSAFNLMALFERGDDITPFLNAYPGYNTLRVWPYAAWGARGWDVPASFDTYRRFLAFVNARGWTVEFTLLTDDKPERLAWAKGIIPQLGALRGTVSLLVELGNEPETHKNIRTRDLQAAIAATGLQFTSGNYEVSSHAFGNYLTHHSSRDSEWPRKAHDCMEFFRGGGPHKPTDPAHRVPCVLDEPGKVQDAKPSPKEDDYRAYYGTASLLAAGATFHCETCKFGELPTEIERRMAAAALEGLNAFPADAPLAMNTYKRPTDSSLRTYIVGSFMVRVRPTTPTPPSAGWTRVGDSAVLWRR